MHVGKKIAQLRKLRDWTQEQLAHKMGVHKSHVSRWESGQMALKIETLERLAEVFGISLDDLTNSSPAGPGSTQLLQDFEALNEDDRLVVRKVLDAMLAKQRMRQALGA